MAIKFKEQLRCKHRKVIPKSLAFMAFGGVGAPAAPRPRSKNDTSISFARR